MRTNREERFPVIEMRLEGFVQALRPIAGSPLRACLIRFC